MAKVGKKVNANQLADAIMNELKDYEDFIVGEAMKKAMKKTAEDAMETVQASSPIRTGEYKSSFEIKEEQNKIIVYSEGLYWKTHLLEKGHALRNGGRVGGTEHWAKGEQTLPDSFNKHFKEELSK